jgi:hypothetical protein
MEYQVRSYEVKAGEMDAWLKEWTREIAPLRRAFGFEVVGAWRGVDDDSFVWILGHDGDFAEADRAYYESAERRALDPDPARHLAKTETRMMARVY